MVLEKLQQQVSASPVEIVFQFTVGERGGVGAFSQPTISSKHARDSPNAGASGEVAVRAALIGSVDAGRNGSQDSSPA